MTSPAAPQPETARFCELIERANTDEYRMTASRAFAIGLFPDRIFDYVRGRLSAAERNEVITLLARSPWAVDRVAALTKARRDPTSLGARILASETIEPSVWGVRSTGDPDLDLAELLNRV